jgi:hypothetical protein
MTSWQKANYARTPVLFPPSLAIGCCAVEGLPDDGIDAMRFSRRAREEVGLAACVLLPSVGEMLLGCWRVAQQLLDGGEPLRYAMSETEKTASAV